MLDSSGPKFGPSREFSQTLRVRAFNNRSASKLGEFVEIATPAAQWPDRLGRLNALESRNH